MAKATLEFNLPDDKSELAMAQRGGDFYCSLREIQNIMREHRKHEKPMKECWEEIGQIVMDANLDEVE